MKHAMLLAPAAFALGMFATPSQAHGEITATVGLPPIVIDAGGVHVILGAPLPPPPQPVVYEPAPPRERVVVVHRAPPPPRTVVVVRERESQRVVYVDDRADCRHGKAWKHKHAKHRGHGRGHGHGDGERYEQGRGHGGDRDRWDT